MALSDLRLFGLPPLGELAKAREVEDPIDRNVYRPIAYVVVGLLRSSPVTPNQLTAFSTVLGMIGGIFWLFGSHGAMVTGGVLVLVSSILDGADGMLARVKKIQSQIGRAVDGSADMLVALTTVPAATYHAWQSTGSWIYLVIVPPVALLTAGSIYLYDYYKEQFLRLATPRKAEGRTLEAITQEKAELTEKGAGWFARFVMNNYATVVRFQNFETGLTNPRVRELERQGSSPEVAAIYRRHNKGPMSVWAWVSLTPHCYLMASLAIADQIHLYLWLRLIVMNALFLVAIVWQRIATARTLRDLGAAGLLPGAAVEDPEERG